MARIITSEIESFAPMLKQVVPAGVKPGEHGLFNTITKGMTIADGLAKSPAVGALLNALPEVGNASLSDELVAAQKTFDEKALKDKAAKALEEKARLSLSIPAPAPVAPVVRPVPKTVIPAAVGAKAPDERLQDIANLRAQGLGSPQLDQLEAELRNMRVVAPDTYARPMDEVADSGMLTQPQRPPYDLNKDGVTDADYKDLRNEAINALESNTRINYEQAKLRVGSPARYSKKEVQAARSYIDQIENGIDQTIRNKYFGESEVSSGGYPDSFPGHAAEARKVAYGKPKKLPGGWTTIPGGESTPVVPDTTPAATTPAAADITRNTAPTAGPAPADAVLPRNTSGAPSPVKSEVAVPVWQQTNKKAPVSDATQKLAERGAARSEEMRASIAKGAAELDDALVKAGAVSDDVRNYAQQILKAEQAKQEADSKTFLDATEKYVKGEYKYDANERPTDYIAPKAPTVALLAKLARLADTPEKQARVFEVAANYELPYRTLEEKFDPRRATTFAKEIESLFPAARKSPIEVALNNAQLATKISLGGVGAGQKQQGIELKQASVETQQAKLLHLIDQDEFKNSSTMDKIEQLERLGIERNRAMLIAASIGAASRGGTPLSLREELDQAQKRADEARAAIRNADAKAAALPKQEYTTAETDAAEKAKVPGAYQDDAQKAALASYQKKEAANLERQQELDRAARERELLPALDKEVKDRFKDLKDYEASKKAAPAGKPATKGKPEGKPTGKSAGKSTDAKDYLP